MSRKLPKKDKIETGIDWASVRSELDSADWEDDEDGDGQARRTFLGTVFALMPSGKYYMPFANSNVDRCPQCGGDGNVRRRRVKRRVLKKWQARLEWIRRLFEKRHLVGNVAGLDRQNIRKHYWWIYRKLHPGSCPTCDGVGSLEARLDEIYMEKLEAEAEEHDCMIESGEGDPCDMFVVEYRDKPEVEEPEEADEDA